MFIFYKIILIQAGNLLILMAKTLGLSKKIHYSLLSAFIAIIATAFFVIDSQKKTIHKSYINISRNFVSNVATLYLNNMIDVVEEKIISASSRFGGDDIFNNAFYHDSHSVLAHMMFIMSKSPEINAVILADTRGHYLRVPEKGSIAKKTPQQIQQRPWFIDEANSQHRVQFTEPYKDLITQVSTVTLSTPVINSHGFFNGVLAFDINLAQLNKNIERLLPPVEGNVVLLSDTGKVIADDIVDETPERHDFQTILSELKKSGGLYYDEHQDRWFFSYRFDGPKWLLVYSVENRALNELVWSESQKVIYGFVISLLVLLFFGFYLKSHWDKTLINIIGHIKTGAPDGWGNLESLLSQEINNTREREAALTAESAHDALTGALNRRAFDKDLQQHIAGNQMFSLALLDIDNFKTINDSFGHLGGDVVLRGMVAECKAVLEQTNGTIYRYGGEEFAIIFSEIPERQAWQLLEQCRLGVRRREWREDISAVTFSAGLGCWNGEEAQTLIAQVDARLYRAKRNGKDQTVAGDAA